MWNRTGKNSWAACKRRLDFASLLLLSRSGHRHCCERVHADLGSRLSQAIPMRSEPRAWLSLTRRTLTQLGTVRYPGSLRLADKEVVLTFDDGPLPRYSNAVLDTLAAQCVKATYFLVGAMAKDIPMWSAGSIRPATPSAPIAKTIHRVSKGHLEKTRPEIDQGIANVGAALGEPNEMAPSSHSGARAVGHGRARARRTLADRLQSRCRRR